MRYSTTVAVVAALTASAFAKIPVYNKRGDGAVTVTVTVEPTEGCEEFLKVSPSCVYCEEPTTPCESTLTSTTQCTSYITSTPEICTPSTVTVTTTPCTTLTTVTPCAGCEEEYVTTQGQTISSCVTTTSSTSTYCTETGSLCVYGAITTTVTYPTTVTYTITTSCASTQSYCEIGTQSYLCPTTVYYQTSIYCTTGVYTLGGMTSECPTSACTVTYPTYCPTTTTYPWYSTVTSACESCPVATVTAPGCLITSITTTYTATSTECTTTGVYTCGTDTVTVTSCPTTIYYVESCPTSYVCSYEDWCSSSKSFIVYEYIGTYLQDVYECDEDEYDEELPWVVTVPTSKFFPSPTIVIINNIRVDITIAPTWYHWDEHYTTHTHTRATRTHRRGGEGPGEHHHTGYPSGYLSHTQHYHSASPTVSVAPGGPFSLGGTIDGVNVILVAEDGELRASSDENAIGTTFVINNGTLVDVNGDVYGVPGLGDIIEYEPESSLAKRAGPFYPGISFAFGENVILGEVVNAIFEAIDLIFSACPVPNDDDTICLDYNLLPGCYIYVPVVVAPGSHPARNRARPSSSGYFNHTRHNFDRHRRFVY